MVTNGNGLGCLIMTAVIDRGFREQLLAEPAGIMSDFDLTEDEQHALTSIRAGSLTEFAAQLHRWLVQRDPLYLALGEETDLPDVGSETPTLTPLKMNGHSPASKNGHHANGTSDRRPLVEVFPAFKSDATPNGKAAAVAVALGSEHLE